MFEFDCPFCKVKIKAGEDRHGAWTRCPKCREPIMVPRADGTFETDPFAVTAAPRLEPPPVRYHSAQIPELSPPFAEDEGRYHADERTGFQCPFCGSRSWPINRKKISAVGWICFFVLFLFLCWPLCWLGLMLREEHRTCSGCGMNLGTVG